MYIFIFTAPTYSSYWCLVGNRWIWMAMGVAGMIITSDYGSFPAFSTGKSLPFCIWRSSKPSRSRNRTQQRPCPSPCRFGWPFRDAEFWIKMSWEVSCAGGEGLGDLYSQKKKCIDGDLPHLPHKNVAKIVIYLRKMLIEWWFTVTNKNSDLSGKNECLIASCCASFVVEKGSPL